MEKIVPFYYKSHYLVFMEDFFKWSEKRLSLHKRLQKGFFYQPLEIFTKVHQG